MKEADMAFATVLNNLFTPMSKRRVKELGLREEEEARYVSRLSREVEAAGALDKIYNGGFCTGTSNNPNRPCRLLRTLPEPAPAGRHAGATPEGRGLVVRVRHNERYDEIGQGVRSDAVPVLHGGIFLPAVQRARRGEGRATKGGLGGSYSPSSLGKCG